MPDRMKDFERFWVQQMLTYDCDPGIYALRYLVARQELNTNQAMWLCWLYACTYNAATTWVLFNEFPDYENVYPERLDAFQRENIKRLPYQKDQKWLRGHLGPMWRSLHEVFGEDLRVSAQFTVADGGYEALWRKTMSLYKVGRYTAWMLLQAWHEVCGLDVEPTSLELNHDSSAMHRGGLALACGKDEWAVKGHKFSAEQLGYLNIAAFTCLTRVRRGFPELMRTGCVQPNLYSMETSLCAYRKLFRRDRGRYLGYYLDRWADDIFATTRCGWPGINWSLIWESRNEGLHPYFNRTTGVDKRLFGLYLDEGEFLPPGTMRDTLNTYYNDRLIRC